MPSSVLHTSGAPIPPFRSSFPGPTPTPTLALVTLEMTESVFVEDAERALVVLDDLKHLGVMLALDDFGTGYSSLCYLKLFPVDVVKIDQGFIAGLAQDPTSSVIVSAVVEMSHVLGMTVVAEGVETAEQHNEIEALAVSPVRASTSPDPCPPTTSPL